METSSDLCNRFLIRFWNLDKRKLKSFSTETKIYFIGTFFKIFFPQIVKKHKINDFFELTNIEIESFFNDVQFISQNSPELKVENKSIFFANMNILAFSDIESNLYNQHLTRQRKIKNVLISFIFITENRLACLKDVSSNEINHSSISTFLDVFDQIYTYKNNIKDDFDNILQESKHKNRVTAENNIILHLNLLKHYKSISILLSEEVSKTIERILPIIKDISSSLIGDIEKKHILNKHKFDKILNKHSTIENIEQLFDELETFMFDFQDNQHLTLSKILSLSQYFPSVDFGLNVTLASVVLQNYDKLVKKAFNMVNDVRESIQLKCEINKNEIILNLFLKEFDSIVENVLVIPLHDFYVDNKKEFDRHIISLSEKYDLLHKKCKKISFVENKLNIYQTNTTTYLKLFESTAQKMVKRNCDEIRFKQAITLLNCDNFLVMLQENTNYKQAAKKYFNILHDLTIVESTKLNMKSIMNIFYKEFKSIYHFLGTFKWINADTLIKELKSKLEYLKNKIMQSSGCELIKLISKLEQINLLLRFFAPKPNEFNSFEKIFNDIYENFQMIDCINSLFYAENSTNLSLRSISQVADINIMNDLFHSICLKIKQILEIGIPKDILTIGIQQIKQNWSEIIINCCICLDFDDYIFNISNLSKRLTNISKILHYFEANLNIRYSQKSQHMFLDSLIAEMNEETKIVSYKHEISQIMNKEETIHTTFNRIKNSLICNSSLGMDYTYAKRKFVQISQQLIEHSKLNSEINYFNDKFQLILKIRQHIEERNNLLWIEYSNTILKLKRIQTSINVLTFNSNCCDEAFSSIEKKFRYSNRKKFIDIVFDSDEKLNNDSNMLTIKIIFAIDLLNHEILNGIRLNAIFETKEEIKALKKEIYFIIWFINKNETILHRCIDYSLYIQSIEQEKCKIRKILNKFDHICSHYKWVENLIDLKILNLTISPKTLKNKICKRSSTKNSIYSSSLSGENISNQLVPIQHHMLHVKNKIIQCKSEIETIEEFIFRINVKSKIFLNMDPTSDKFTHRLAKAHNLNYEHIKFQDILFKLKKFTNQELILIKLQQLTQQLRNTRKLLIFSIKYGEYMKNNIDIMSNLISNLEFGKFTRVLYSFKNLPHEISSIMPYIEKIKIFFSNFDLEFPNLKEYCFVMFLKYEFNKIENFVNNYEQLYYLKIIKKHYLRIYEKNKILKHFIVEMNQFLENFHIHQIDNIEKLITSSLIFEDFGESILFQSNSQLYKNFTNIIKDEIDSYNNNIRISKEKISLFQILKRIKTEFQCDLKTFNSYKIEYRNFIIKSIESMEVFIPKYGLSPEIKKNVIVTDIIENMQILLNKSISQQDLSVNILSKNNVKLLENRNILYTKGFRFIRHIEVEYENIKTLALHYYELEFLYKDIHLLQDEYFKDRYSVEMSQNEFEFNEFQLDEISSKLKQMYKNINKYIKKISPRYRVILYTKFNRVIISILLLMFKNIHRDSVFTDIRAFIKNLQRLIYTHSYILETLDTEHRLLCSDGEISKILTNQDCKNIVSKKLYYYNFFICNSVSAYHFMSDFNLYFKTQIGINETIENDFSANLSVIKSSLTNCRRIFHTLTSLIHMAHSQPLQNIYRITSIENKKNNSIDSLTTRDVSDPIISKILCNSVEYPWVRKIQDDEPYFFYNNSEDGEISSVNPYFEDILIQMDFICKECDRFSSSLILSYLKNFIKTDAINFEMIAEEYKTEDYFNSNYDLIDKSIIETAKNLFLVNVKSKWCDSESSIKDHSIWVDIIVNLFQNVYFDNRNIKMPTIHTFIGLLIVTKKAFRYKLSIIEQITKHDNDSCDKVKTVIEIIAKWTTLLENISHQSNYYNYKNVYSQLLRNYKKFKKAENLLTWQSFFDWMKNIDPIYEWIFDSK